MDVQCKGGEGGSGRGYLLVYERWRWFELLVVDDDDDVDVYIDRLGGEGEAGDEAGGLRL